LGLAGVGLAASLAFRPAPPNATPTSADTTRASLAANESLVERSGTAVPAVIAGRESHGTSPAQQGSAGPAAQTVVAQAQPPVAKPAPVCQHCGVVEAVHAVQKKGKGTGVGAVAGGVVGGVVGNQFGHGNGRAAMTVLGAVGGGLAGNEIEKRSRSTTVYDVQVRMDDGRVRHFEQATALAKGARVTIEGNKLHLAQSRGRAPAGNGSARG
jgi:outer membrane lipoprotein SlyB